MKCPSCGNLKQLTPESRRTETAVWRRRICKSCHHTWLTEEHISASVRMPAEVQQFLDTMRHTPKHKPAEKKPAEPKFDTRGLAGIRW
jgi:transcriptional regulator NrdR family protein